MIQQRPDGQIVYKGEVAAKHTRDAEHEIVEIKLTYRVPRNEDWVGPLNQLAIGLKAIEPPPPPIALQFTASIDDAELSAGNVLLLEAQIKLAGYVWVFHKVDEDTWPSALHGHDYGKGLKIDAISGGIFTVESKSRLGALKKKKLIELQSALREHKDFKDRAGSLLPPLALD